MSEKLNCTIYGAEVALAMSEILLISEHCQKSQISEASDFSEHPEVQNSSTS